MQKAIFSIPLNPKLSPEAFARFYSIVEKYKDYIYDIYFTSRMPPFVQDAMGDAFDKNQADDIIENAFILQNNLGIPLSATFNNIEVETAEKMTIEGTVNKTAMSLLLLMAAASYTWINPSPELMMLGFIG